MEGFVSATETIRDEGAEDTVLLVEAVEERAHMATLAKVASGERERIGVTLHGSPPRGESCGASPASRSRDSA
ncbi:MAG TPA: hypothetical protein VGO39_08995 [Gaiellaceae bacterium]|nr:hypothetical protein [Gaiellaceae bacterium]